MNATQRHRRHPTKQGKKEDKARHAMATINDLPDDVLYYIVDAWIDDCSLGACLLAWRRFHVLDRARLFQRKYRLATPLALCAAGDMDGLDYTLQRPGVFGGTDDRVCLIERVCAAQTRGHARMTMRLMRALDPIERFSLHQWSSLAVAAALRGPADSDLAWLCRPENRPTEKWDDVSLIRACARAIESGHSADAILTAVDLIESLTGFSIGAPRDVWSRLPVKSAPAAPYLHLITGILSEATESRSDVRRSHLYVLVRDGHWRLLLDLLGDKRLALLLANDYSRVEAPLDDVDCALWIYDHVLVHATTIHRISGLRSLACAVARSNRTDLFGGVDSRAAVAWEKDQPWEQARMWERTYAAAAIGGHAASIEWALGHQIEPVGLGNAFCYCDYYDIEAMPESYRQCRIVACAVRSPLVVYKHRCDLFRLLLDRRPRPGIPQSDIDARVDHMVNITVRHALSQGDLSVVRRVHVFEPRAVEADVANMRTMGTKSS